jgi:IS4 transposase
VTAVDLSARRWDIELAFKLVKNDLAVQHDVVYTDVPPVADG